MSRWSGKADLADHIAGMGGWYDKDGNPVKFGQEGVGAYYSDELQDFREFKRRTGGVIYQHKYIKNVDEWNQDLIAKKCPNFKVIKHINKTTDKRTKEGYREVVSYTYEYWGKEYTQKEINKRGVYITVEIHFDTLLDIIKYYPYIVSACCSDEDKMTVYISNESFVDEEYEEHLKHGWDSGMRDHYNKELAEHYLEVVKEYYLKDIDERTAYIFMKSAKPAYEDEQYVYFKSTHDIDDLHKAEWCFNDGKMRAHWDSPKIVDSHTIKIDKVNLRYMADAIEEGKVAIKYVITGENDVILN